MKKIVILLSIGFLVIFFGFFFLVSRLLPNIVPVLKKFPAAREAVLKHSGDKAGIENNKLPADSAEPPNGVYPEPALISSPDMNDFLDNKFVLEGTAPGAWFKDEVLAVNLLDANGKKIAVSYASGQGIWTKDSKVEFRAEFEYFPPPTEQGSLVFVDGFNNIRYIVPVKFRSTTAWAGEPCSLASDCRLPADFAIRSICPYRIECQHNKCTVVCPDF
jgi:hypothetical protein